MPDQRIVIIGAGLAGLAAGIYARLNGFQATICEHHRKPGGVSATWKRKGFVIDGGIHFYMGCLKPGSTQELFKTLGVFQREKYQPMESYATFLDPSEDRRLEVSSDLESFVRKAKEISPEDGQFLDQFLAGAKAFSKGDLASAMEKPPDLTTFLDTLKMFWSMRSSLRYYSGTFAKPMTEVVQEIKHPWLREVFLNFFLPGVPYFFNLMLAGLLMSRNLAVRTDGSAGFNQALEERFTELGGQVRYRSRVEKILVQGGRAVGVRLEDGEEIRADYVVSAADGNSTLFDLLGPEHVPPALAKVHQDLDLFDPIVLVNVGVGREFSDLPEAVVFKPSEPPSAGHLIRDWWFVRVFGQERGFTPPGKTLFQVMVDSAWEPWERLRQDQEAYLAEKENLGAQVVQGLESLAPGLTESVEMVDVASPHTWWRYTLNRKGAYEGFAVTQKSFHTKIKRTLPGLDRFVMAGQWTMPGGGAIPSLLTGRHAVMIVCREEGRRFISEG